MQDALDRAALWRRHLLEDFGLLLLRQVFKDVRCVVGIEVAHALGDGLGRQIFEDLFANGILDLSERREIELAAEQFDKTRAQVGIERLDQVAGVGLMQFADQRLQGCGVAAFDSLPHVVEEFRADRAIVVAEGGSRRRPGHVSLIDHAGLAVASVWNEKMARLYAPLSQLAIARHGPIIAIF
jgi:hypothetical protein